MSTVQPTGPIATTAFGIASMLSQCVAFQRRAKIDNPADALNFVRYVCEEESFGVIQRPVVIIESGPVGHKQSSAMDMMPDASAAFVDLLLTDWDRHPMSENDSFLDFANFVDGVMHDEESQTGLADLAFSDGNLCIAKMALAAPIQYTKPSEQNQDRSQNYWMALIHIQFAN